MLKVGIILPVLSSCLGRELLLIQNLAEKLAGSIFNTTGSFTWITEMASVDPLLQRSQYKIRSKRCESICDSYI
jgi:hypothetical protein